MGLEVSHKLNSRVKKPYERVEVPADKSGMLEDIIDSPVLHGSDSVDVER